MVCDSKFESAQGQICQQKTFFFASTWWLKKGHSRSFYFKRRRNRTTLHRSNWTGDTQFKFVLGGFRLPKVSVSSFDHYERENPYCWLTCSCTIPLACLNHLLGSQICPPSRSKPNSAFKTPRSGRSWEIDFQTELHSNSFWSSLLSQVFCRHCAAPSVSSAHHIMA